MLERESHLDQASNASRGLEVADIGFDRAQGARAPARTIDGQHRAERLRLDRIAQECARAVCLDVLNAAGRDPGAPISFSQDGFLGQRIRRHQPVAPSVLIHRAAANHGVNRIGVGQGFRQRLQNDETGALTANVAVGSRIEGLAAAVRSHHAGFAEIDRNRRGEDQVHASGQMQAWTLRSKGCGRPDGPQRATRNRRCRLRCSARGSRTDKRGGWPRCSGHCRYPRKHRCDHGSFN